MKTKHNLKIRNLATSKLGWIPDLPDQRDLMYSVSMEVMAVLPPSIDLRPNCPPVYDQGELGSCTANAIAGAYQFDEMKQNNPAQFIPSRLFIYYNERVMENTVSTDSGAQIRDGIKSVNQVGVCAETIWPYIIADFTQDPSPACYAAAANNKTLSYSRLTPVLNQIKGCLASGNPFVFGFTVYESFMTPEVAKTGIMPLPKANEHVEGGHAVMAVGYDDATNMVIVRNSWGKVWGQEGYFMMPYSYITNTNLADDFWAIKIVEK